MTDIKGALERGRTLRLDLGCGPNRQQDAVGVDIVPGDCVDIVCDLEAYPWPFPDGCASVVFAVHLLEYINPARGGFVRFMDEAWRVLKPDGTFVAATWYPTSRAYMSDPCHVNMVNEITWSYFDPLDEKTQGLAYKVYRPLPWKIDKLFWNEAGNLEVSLIKRREDPSYGRK